MDNLANAIVIVGIGFLSIWGTYLWIDSIIIAIGLALAFVVALITWVQLDSGANNKQRKLKFGNMELENEKLELENKKLEIEIDQLRQTPKANRQSVIQLRKKRK